MEEWNGHNAFAHPLKLDNCFNKVIYHLVLKSQFRQKVEQHSTFMLSTINIRNYRHVVFVTFMPRGRPKLFLSVSGVAETRPWLRNNYKVVTEPGAETLWQVSAETPHLWLSDWSIQAIRNIRNEAVVVIFRPVVDPWGMRDGATVRLGHGRLREEGDMSYNMFSVWPLAEDDDTPVILQSLSHFSLGPDSTVDVRQRAETRFHLRL